jgi:hypothetical protein
LPEVSRWYSQDLLDLLLDCLPIYFSVGINKSGSVDAKSAFISIPILLEELLSRHEKCESDLYCDLLKLPRSSTYAQIADFLKNSNAEEVCFSVNLIAAVRAYKQMQKMDVSVLSAKEKKKHQQQLEFYQPLIQSISTTASS